MKTKTFLWIEYGFGLLVAIAFVGYSYKQPQERKQEIPFWLPAKAELVAKPDVSPTSEADMSIFVYFDQYRSMFQQNAHQLYVNGIWLNYRTRSEKFNFTTSWHILTDVKAPFIYSYDHADIYEDGKGIVVMKRSNMAILPISLLIGALGALSFFFLIYMLDTLVYRKTGRGFVVNPPWKYFNQTG